MKVFRNTARRANTKTKPWFAFGESSNGFAVFKLAVNHDSTVRGGLSKRWVVVAKDLSHDDAVKLMNKRLHKKEFLLEAEKTLPTP